MPQVVRIINVVLEPAGNSLHEDHLAGTTTLNLADASEFLDESGNMCLIDENTYTLGVAVSTDDADQVDISPGLATDLIAGTRVDLLPLSDQKKAHFVFPDDEEDSKTAYVSLEMDAFLEVGVRTPEEAEYAEVDLIDGDYKVVRVINKRPYIEPEYLPPADYLRTDEVPPDVPTQVTLQGAINSVFVQFPPVINREVVTYEIYASTNAGVLQDASYYVGEAKANRFTIYEVYSPIEQKKVRLKQGTIVYVRVLARDSDGTSALSEEVTSQALGVTGPDIAVGAVTADKILGNEITADKLAGQLAMLSEIQMGSRMTLKPSGEKNGLYIELNEVNGQKGAIHLPADGSRARVDAGINAKGLLSEYNLVVQGTGNRMQSGMMMASGVKAPTEPPSVVPYYNVSQNVVIAGSGAVAQSMRGMHWDGSLYSGGGGWWTTRRDSIGRNYVCTVNWANGVLTDEFAISAAYSNVYAAGVGRGQDGNVYVVTQNNENQNWMLYRFNIYGTQLANRSLGTVSELQSVSLCVQGGWVHWASHRSSDNKIGLSRTQEGTANMATHSSCISTGTSPGIGTAMYIGAADVGSTRMWIAEYGSGANFFKCYTPAFAASPGSMNRDGTYDFSFARGANPGGLMFPGGRFYSQDPSNGTVYNYSVIATAFTANVGYTFFDSNTTGGQHETTIGPQASVTFSRRAFHRVTCASPPNMGGPDDPDSVRIYYNNNRQADLGPGVISAGYDAMAATGVGAPNSNGFAGIPNATGYMYSEASDAYGSKVYLTGTGGSRVGPLSWDDAATVANLSIASTGLILPGNTNRYFRLLSWGLYTYNVPANQTNVTITIGHGATSTPSIAICNAVGSGTNIFAKWGGSITATTFNINIQKPATGAVDVPIAWFVIG